MSDARRIVTILGGYGIFGGRDRRGAGARRAFAACASSAAGPAIGANFAHRIGAEFRECRDNDDRETIRQAIEGSFLVIHAAGPFQGADYRCGRAVSRERGALPRPGRRARLCRGHRPARRSGAPSAGCLVASGVSSTPAITSALIAELAPEFGRIEEIHTALSPGNQNPRGEATIAAVLSYLGRTIRCLADGQWVERPGWGDVTRLDVPAARRPAPRAQLRGARAGAVSRAVSGGDGPLLGWSGAEHAQLPALVLCALEPMVRARLHTTCPILPECLADALPVRARPTVRWRSG